MGQVELLSRRPAPAESTAHLALLSEVAFPGLLKMSQLLRALQDSPRQSLSSTHCPLRHCPPVTCQGRGNMAASGHRLWHPVGGLRPQPFAYLRRPGPASAL